MAWNKLWTWDAVRDAREANKVWKPSKAAERAYAKQLKSVADRVAEVLSKAPTPAVAERQLREYAEALDPWARQAAANMVRKVSKRNGQSWREAAARWGIDLKGFLEADISKALRERTEENVRLIKSLATDVADEVAKLAEEAVVSGLRAEGLARKISAKGDVSMSRARTIARTEVSKAGTALTKARAESVGSEGYIWRTAGDANTRTSHQAMSGRFVRWDTPPTLDGMTGHAGEFPNCRCYPEPVVHDSSGQAVGSPLPTV